MLAPAGKGIAYLDDCKGMEHHRGSTSGWRDKPFAGTRTNEPLTHYIYEDFSWPLLKQWPHFRGWAEDAR